MMQKHAMSKLLPHVGAIRKGRPHSSLIGLARQYDVSEDTMRTFCRANGIDKPKTIMEFVESNRLLIRERIKSGVTMTTLAAECRQPYAGFKYACIKIGLHRNFDDRTNGDGNLNNSAVNRLLMRAWR